MQGEYAHAFSTVPRVPEAERKRLRAEVKEYLRKSLSGSEEELDNTKRDRAQKESERLAKYTIVSGGRFNPQAERVVIMTTILSTAATKSFKP